MLKRYCDFQNCGALIGPDGFHAKVKKAPGRLGNRELDLCADHSIEVERLVLGRNDEDKGPAPRLRSA